MKKFEHPDREGDRLYIIRRDGTREPIDAMEAMILADEWVSVISGALVHGCSQDRPRVDRKD